MFTGIIEEIGRVVAVDDHGTDARLVVHGPLVTSDARDGDSIAVSGVCLTVTSLGDDGTFVADVMPESMARTTLGRLAPGDPVNLERALPANGRLGGHIVQGHVDGVGQVVARVPGERWEDVEIALPPALARYVAEKGSITVDGVSLTVTTVTPTSFGISLIPATLAHTTLHRLAEGDPVNLEVDILAKYTERLLTAERVPTTEAPR
ncbi:MAG: riboflavin synthase [Micrococcales bacterium]|nr:riboflavin synthase [Micrococcales bacterium]